MNVSQGVWNNETIKNCQVWRTAQKGYKYVASISNNSSQHNWYDPGGPYIRRDFVALRLGDWHFCLSMGEGYVSQNDTLTQSGSNATPVVYNNLPEAQSQCHCCIVEDSHMEMKIDDLASAKVRRGPISFKPSTSEP